ncbi:MAG: RNA methyltransferase [Proteobacteria bacterium]|nr:RNA methyltransferase [Pseudomonadota bacterium]
MPLRHPPTGSAPPAPHPALEPAAIIRALGPVLAPRRRQRIDRVVAHRLWGVTVVLEAPHDPHNAAAVLRSCEALGLLDVHIVPAAGGFTFSRRVTQHADKWLNIYLHRSVEGCLDWLTAAGFICCAACPPPLGASAPTSAWSPPAGRPLALVFGNEHAGLSASAAAACARRVHLPMHGFGESLNLSVAAALAVAAAVEARRRWIGAPGDLPASARARLRAAYYVRATTHGVSRLLALLEPSPRHKVPT